ncbi:acetyltransferase [Sanguibacter keddieii DSM 10542]|uniref:Acetyltransferase n=1 Tax=Sanguibacter keddieii (strain ATCC 51767 / DSM 10542 / NCFB 3025 / ST-74) TaxID=446469 RepID=D1BEQ2_SANKS|nr:acetyltransferase [Sanguibacter keddieii DSM 10542]
MTTRAPTSVAGCGAGCSPSSVLSTQYYDDVRPRRAPLEERSVGLVAVSPSPEGEEVVGILDVDVEVDAAEATIDTLAVHPDHARSGIGAAMLAVAVGRLRAQGLGSLDAWTREDAAANGWYQAQGFVERYRYVHVHKEGGDDPRGFRSPEGLSTPVRAFAHAPLEMEAQLRAEFSRVYVCRQYVLNL